MHQPSQTHHHTSQADEFNQPQAAREDKDYALANPSEYEPEIQKKLKIENPHQSLIPNQSLISNQNQVANQVLRSREIHKRLQEKKSGWKPGEKELSTLRSSFVKNQYPTREEKERLEQLLQEKFDSKVDITKLGRWFQRQRERSTKAGDSGMKKSTYKKFGKADLEYLHGCFNKNTYPKREDMNEMASKLDSSLSKIENWFKHTRRSMAKKNLLSVKMKKYFKKNELEYLNKWFSVLPRPTKEKYKDMAKTLGCDEAPNQNLVY